jgi:hypothetical protein
MIEMVEYWARVPVVPETNPPDTELVTVTPPAAASWILPVPVWTKVRTVPIGKATVALMGIVIVAAAALEHCWAVFASARARV